MPTSPIIPAHEAQCKLVGLIDRVNDTHAPVTITSQQGNAVLVSEEDWWAIEKTLNLEEHQLSPLKA
ncbi:type II toxin-antitoxin system Phd/YefM family antitoxin [Acaryochloris sp. CCMEE 5410]|uniref:type II toxin-antitoxin system Phd/YefM family antitoxin n=1 Tax=Acaryochloris sp. CCMEE 5410 TaxID=310037 RepID=UPI0002483F42|nr:type II toxin-antitoxin system Phd/YefM family antitoxin [Acaryochloris sp. CCMEE 5410]KAI9130960.1 type II toxin-antitoxin system Phd/YefM family antitoxin [Acaryochloris sp. CCMEE 5410]